LSSATDLRSFFSARRLHDAGRADQRGPVNQDLIVEMTRHLATGVIDRISLRLVRAILFDGVNFKNTRLRGKM
jgi:hypothetical protein